jgi:hypothetical protein
VTLWWPADNPEFTQRGIALGLLATNAAVNYGLSLAPVVGGGSMYGLNVGLACTSATGILRGLNYGSFLTWGGEEVTGLNVGMIVSGGDLIRGLTLGLVYISPRPVTDILEPHRGWLKGINLSGLIIDYPGALGLTAAGINRIRHARGLTLGYFMNDVREDAVGLNVAPFNFTKRLRGVQIGLLNHVDANPHPFKWLPIMNIGFGDRADTPEREDSPGDR